LSILRLMEVVTEAQERVRSYVTASLHYMENALLMVSQGDAGKASELLWGSVAEAVQALATSRGKQLTNHRSLHWFIGVLSKELNDRSIAEAFYLAENLHQKGFHEVELDIRDVALVLESIRKLVEKLLDLIPKELINEPLENV
jgi:hypothetical protein